MLKEEIKLEQEQTAIPAKSHKNIIWLSIILLLFIIILFIARLILIAPFTDKDLYCEFSPKFNKFTCIQTGDIVPKWFDINENGLFGAKYSMKLVIKNKNNNYKTLEMTDGVFIPDLQRKFIYEVKEQTMWDYIKFKNSLINNSRYNWGSVALYCSENNLSEQICKNMKKYNK